MTGFIPEITTTVKVETQTNYLDDAIGLMEQSDVMSQCFSEIIDYLNDRKEQIDSLRDPLAETIAESLSSHQAQVIGMNGTVKTGMMMNSVDVSQDGDGVYLVGNTATSVDGFPYPLAIEQGSKAHWIAPVTFHALHWTDKDGEHFSRGHMVSGITPKPFVDYSINLTESTLEGLIEQYIKGVFE